MAKRIGTRDEKADPELAEKLKRACETAGSSEVTISLQSDFYTFGTFGISAVGDDEDDEGIPMVLSFYKRSTRGAKSSSMTGTYMAPGVTSDMPGAPNLALSYVVENEDPKPLVLVVNEGGGVLHDDELVSLEEIAELARGSQAEIKSSALALKVHIPRVVKACDDGGAVSIGWSNNSF